MPDFAANLLQEKTEYLDANGRVSPGQLLVNSGPVVKVAIRSLRIAGSPRIAGENLEHVRVLADIQDELPPIIVHRATMRVIDGLHRLRAAELRNQHEITVRFFDGDESDAFVLAVRSNVAHGLPLSLADRKAAATHIIESHPRWSDRLIASVTALSPKTIAELRRNGADETFRSGSRIGQDGRARPIDSLEKRRIASNLILDNPNLSLRQVARTAGISPETVRAVRARLLRGEDPVLPKQRTTKPKQSQNRELSNKQGVDTRPAHLSTADWNSIVQRLRADPTIRFTEAGRALLRLLDMHAMSTEKWGTIVNNVPPHCRHTIAKMAMECARIWSIFAENLERNLPVPK